MSPLTADGRSALLTRAADAEQLNVGATRLLIRPGSGT
jgi:hypothetical protein